MSNDPSLSESESNSASTPPENPTQPPKKDWLHQVARATQTVAPLVNREAPEPEMLPQDRRGRWATLLAMVGILVAVFQFIINFFDLLARPIAPLMKALPYVLAALFLTGAGLAIVAARRAHTRRQRLQSLLVATLICVVGASWAGWLAYDYLRPPAGFLIAVGEFDGTSAGQRIDFARRIAEHLKTQLADAGEPVEIKRTLEAYADAETARAQGQRLKAGMVIWGWYDDMGVSPHVEVLNLPGQTRESIQIPILFSTASAASPGDLGAPLQPTLRAISTVARTPDMPPDVDLFVAYGPDQMIFVTAAILGMNYLANGDQQKAMDLFDRALASVEGDPTAVQGQEVIRYQRALINYRAGKYADAKADLEAALKAQPDFYEGHNLLAVVLAEGCTPTRQLDQALVEAQAAAALRPDDAAAHRLVADLSLQLGQLDGALSSAQIAKQLAPEAPAGYTLLANIYAAQKQDADARAARQTALALWQKIVDDPAQATADALYALGDAHLALDDDTAALAAYQAASQLAPSDLRVHRSQANVYYWQGQYDRAIQEYHNWTAKAPTDPSPHLLLGLLLEEIGKPEDALAAYRQSAQLATCDPSPHMVLGNAYLLRGDIAAADASYQAALAIEPTNPDVLYAAGVTRYEQEKYAEAAPLLEAALARRPELAQAAFALGVVYEHLDQPEKAKAAYEQVVNTAGNAPAPTTTLAFAYEELGRVDEAIAIYVELLDEGETADLHAYLGSLYEQKGAPDLALPELRRAVEMNPSHLPALLSLGGLAYTQGDLQGAAAAYERYVALEDSALVRSMLADIYVGLGDQDAAYRQLQSARALEPINPDYVRELGQLALQLGRLDEATEHFDQAQRLQPDSHATHFARSQVEYKRCNLDRAIVEMERAVSLAPDNSLYTGILAGYYAAQGRDQDARSLLDKLQKGSDTDSIAHLFAGGLLAVTNRNQDAQQEFKLALANPDVPPILAALAANALGQLYLTGNDLPAAQEVFSSTLDFVPTMAEAQVGLGDIALLQKDGASALRIYEEAIPMLEPYGQQYSLDSAAVLEPAIYLRIALVHRMLGDTDASLQMLQTAAAHAQTLVDTTPQWPSGHFARAMVLAAAGDQITADAEFDAAIACDATLKQARETFLTQLALLR